MPSRYSVVQSQKSHLEALREKHTILKKLIDQEQSNPGAEYANLKQLKRQKLQIKERIEMMQSETTAMAAGSAA